MRNLIVITLVLTGLLSASATADAFGRRCRGTVVVSSCPTYYYSCPAYYYSCPTTVIEEVPVFAVSPYMVPPIRACHTRMGTRTGRLARHTKMGTRTGRRRLNRGQYPA